ncbi:unnamed protein product, partial [Haemonchus placei]|uniref:RxLR effector candidate n=1 Tax=Haemonchus placei TaxID=6290 RepID=A0A0N4XA01_HAEPC
VQSPTSSDKPSSSEATTPSSVAKRDPPQLEEVPETSRPIPAPRTTLVERNSETSTVVSSVDRISPTVGHQPAAKSMQIKAPRSVITSNNTMQTSAVRQERDIVSGGSLSSVRRRMGTKDTLADVDARLSSSIARLSRSVYGELNEQEQSPTKNNRLSIPAMRRDRCSSEKRIDQTGKGSSSELERWKKRSSWKHTVTFR